MVGFKIASSRTLRENPSNDWKGEWNMDRFMETSSIWQAIAIDLARSVEVDPADMNKLSEKFVAVLVEKNLLHPIPAKDVYQNTQEPALCIHRKGQPSEGLRPQQALAEDPVYQERASFDQFLLVCEKLIYKWSENQLHYDFRNKKRAPSPADSSRDSKKTKSSQPPKAEPMVTEVGTHCEGCGKPNHLRQDCTSGHAPKHPDFNEEGKWVGCASYKTIARASTQPCASTFAPMEHPWYSSRRRSRTHPQPAKRQRLSALQ